MNKAHLGDQEDNAVLVTDLHGDREVVGSFGREKDFDNLLLERRIAFMMIDFNDLELTNIDCTLINHSSKNIHHLYFTFALPLAVRTANEKSLVGLCAFSNVNSANAAA
jgi:hypothetical protein